VALSPNPDGSSATEDNSERISYMLECESVKQKIKLVSYIPGGFDGKLELYYSGYWQGPKKRFEFEVWAAQQQKNGFAIVICTMGFSFVSRLNVLAPIVLTEKEPSGNPSVCIACGQTLPAEKQV
jgi:hypothetical protein